MDLVKGTQRLSKGLWVEPTVEYGGVCSTEDTLLSRERGWKEGGSPILALPLL